MCYNVASSSNCLATFHRCVLMLLFISLTTDCEVGFYRLIGRSRQHIDLNWTFWPQWHSSTVDSFSTVLKFCCWRRPLWPKCTLQSDLSSATSNHLIKAPFMITPHVAVSLCDTPVQLYFPNPMTHLELAQ